MERPPWCPYGRLGVRPPSAPATPIGFSTRIVAAWLIVTFILLQATLTEPLRFQRIQMNPAPYDPWSAEESHGVESMLIRNKRDTADTEDPDVVGSPGTTEPTEFAASVIPCNSYNGSMFLCACYSMQCSLWQDVGRESGADSDPPCCSDKLRDNTELLSFGGVTLLLANVSAHAYLADDLDPVFRGSVAKVINAFCRKDPVTCESATWRELTPMHVVVISLSETNATTSSDVTATSLPRSAVNVASTANVFHLNVTFLVLDPATDPAGTSLTHVSNVTIRDDVTSGVTSGVNLTEMLLPADLVARILDSWRSTLEAELRLGVLEVTALPRAEGGPEGEEYTGIPAGVIEFLGTLAGVIVFFSIISAIKAVKDRKAIKARNAARQEERRKICQETDDPTEPNSPKTAVSHGNGTTVAPHANGVSKGAASPQSAQVVQVVVHSECNGASHANNGVLPAVIVQPRGTGDNEGHTPKDSPPVAGEAARDVALDEIRVEDERPANGGLLQPPEAFCSGSDVAEAEVTTDGPAATQPQASNSAVPHDGKCAEESASGDGYHGHEEGGMSNPPPDYHDVAAESAPDTTGGTVNEAFEESP